MKEMSSGLGAFARVAGATNKHAVIAKAQRKRCILVRTPEGTSLLEHAGFQSRPRHIVRWNGLFVFCLTFSSWYQASARTRMLSCSSVSGVHQPGKVGSHENEDDRQGRCRTLPGQWAQVCRLS